MTLADNMAHKISLLLNLVLFGSTLWFGYQWAFVTARESVVARSISPDSQLECLVELRQPPPVWCARGYYIFSIQRNGIPLSGNQCVVNLDSETFRPLSFAWSDGGLAVLEEDSLTTTGRSAKAVYSVHNQQWTFQHAKMKKDG